MGLVGTKPRQSNTSQKLTRTAFPSTAVYPRSRFSHLVATRLAIGVAKQLFGVAHGTKHFQQRVRQRGRRDQMHLEAERAEMRAALSLPQLPNQNTVHIKNNSRKKTQRVSALRRLTGAAKAQGYAHANKLHRSKSLPKAHTSLNVRNSPTSTPQPTALIVPSQLLTRSLTLGDESLRGVGHTHKAAHRENKAQNKKSGGGGGLYSRKGASYIEGSDASLSSSE